MNNVFVVSALPAGAMAHQAARAVGCCLSRLARGVYAVERLCEQEAHRAFACFVDRPELLSDEGSSVYLRKLAHHAGWAVAFGHSGQAILSHATAAVLWGMELPTDPPARLQTSGPERPFSRTHRIHRQRAIPAEHITSPVSALPELRAVSADWTMFDLLRDVGGAEGFAIADRHIRFRAHGRASGVPSADRFHVVIDELAEVFRQFEECSAGRRTVTMLSWLKEMRGLSESAGEALAYFRFYELGFRCCPEDSRWKIAQQVSFPLPGESYRPRVDFFLEHWGLIVEFDGWAKYQDPNGSVSPEVYRKEKRREEQLRRMGYRFLRIEWRDVIVPGRLASLLRQVGVVLP